MLNVLTCISKINIFACILLKPSYLLNYCVEKVNIYINYLVYFVLKHICKVTNFVCIPLNPTYLLNYCARKVNISLIT